LRALGGEGARGGGADARAPAGDQRDLAGEAGGAAFCLSLSRSGSQNSISANCAAVAGR